jgi:hypothetical protein
MDLVYDSDVIGVKLLVPADEVEVTGQLTSDGAALTGVTISFIPDDVALPTVEVESGAYGMYSAFVVPASYTVSVDFELVNTLGTWYQYESEQVFAPSGSAISLDIDAVLRVHVQGNVLGAAVDITLRFAGPEQVSMEIDSLTYSVYLMPGTYSVYATGTIGYVPYACMESIDVSPLEAHHDILLERAYSLSGSITVDGVFVQEPVAVIITSEQDVHAVNESTRYGYYYMVLPAGTYAVSFLLEEVKHAEDQSIYYEHWSDMMFTIGSDDVVIDPDLDTRLDNATVEGTVVDEDGDPITAFIELFPLDRYGMYARFATGSSGGFSAEVQPGEYTVYVTRSVDRRVSISYLLVSRNVGASADIQLSNGQYLAGRSTIADVPTAEQVRVTSGDTKLTATPSADGYFQFLVPSGNYTVSSSAVRVEGGMTVSYSLTKPVSIGDSSAYLDFELLRDTRRSVDASWDSNRTATLAAGETVSYVMSLENTGNIADSYELSYSGTSFEVSFDPSEVWIDFGSNGNTAYVVADVTVGVTAVSGNNTVTVTVTSSAHTSTRATVDLMVQVLPVRSVAVESLNTSAPVSSNVTTTTFLLNNTGNVEDDFILSVINTDALASSGWSARIVDPASGGEVANVTLAAFETRQLTVEFTAIRSTPDPYVEAVVLASSSVDAAVNGYGAVPVMLSDVVVGPGDLDVVRDDVTYEYDTDRLYLDIGLVVALAALVVMFFVIRKRKGLGGGGKR